MTREGLPPQRHIQTACTTGKTWFQRRHLTGLRGRVIMYGVVMDQRARRPASTRELIERWEG